VIDTKQGVKRYIAEYSKKTDKLVKTYDLDAFEIAEFQTEFNVDSENPMFDCFSIKLDNIGFMQKFLSISPNWDFASKAYFIEAHTLE